MNSLRMVFGTVGAAIFVFGWVTWMESALSVRAQLPVHDSSPASTRPMPFVTDEIFIHVQPRQPRIDLYGNEVDRAIGDYRIDPRGDLYERHSPHTELPKLAPPSA